MDSTPTSAASVGFQVDRPVERLRGADECYNRGTELAGLGQHESAVSEFLTGLDQRPQDAAMWNNLGNSRLALGQWAEAEVAFANAMKYDRRNPVIIANRVNALNLRAADRRRCGHEAEALPLLRLAVQLKPDLAESWNNLGTVLHDLRQLEEGEHALRQALSLRGDYALAMGNLANLLIDRARFQEAMDYYQRVVALEPASPVAHWNMALAQLASGDLVRGFAEFEWRLRLPHAAAAYSNRDAPLWQGESLVGRRIQLFAEQGLGDTLQFVRYVSTVVAMGAEVILECQASLGRLLAPLPGVTRVVVPGENVAPPPDFVCPLMSLPHRLGTSLDSIPCDIPYLDVDAVRVAEWGRRFVDRPRRFRVGLVWAGEARKHEPDAHRIDQRRSMALDDFSPLLDIGGLEFFSLQKGPASAQVEGGVWQGRITDWSDDFTDFLETAALVSHLDLVIGVDTSVIHLAAAMGKPTWVLSRFDGCWRWLRDRDDSPWYPTLRLFRQEKPLVWGPVVGSVAVALAALIKDADVYG